MAQQLNIYQRLSRIRKQVEVIQKNKDGFNYRYVSDDELLARITTLMDKYNLSLIPSVSPTSMRVEPYSYTKTKVSKKTGEVYEEKNNEIIVGADMMFEWVCNDNPDDYIKVPWICVGQQGDSAQAFGSALTYSMRYFLLKYFNIATPNDDVDSWRSKQRATEAAEDKAIASQLIERLDASVKDFLRDNPESASAVKEFVGKYVKDGNYFKIHEPMLATKLLSDFEENFLNKEEK